MKEWLDPVFAWAGRLIPDVYLQALAVIVMFVLLAKLLDLAVGTAVARLLRSWNDATGNQLARIGRRTVFRTVALSGLMIATTMVELSPRLEANTHAIIATLLILIWIGAGIRMSTLVVGAMSQRVTPPPWARSTTAPLLNNMLRVVLALAGAYAVMIAWDVNVAGLVASAGIIGLALSFAAQDTLGNLFAGVAILTDQPYRIGDYIVLDSGERGQVTHIGLRSTRILTRDDEEISIPNGIMGKAKIINESGGPYVKYRIRVRVGVAYGSDIDKVMSVLLAVAIEHPHVCRDPEPRVRFRAFGESSLDFEVLVWIAQPALRGPVLHELNCEIYRAFGREGVTIPFPQRDVHVRDWRTPAGAG